MNPIADILAANNVLLAPMAGVTEAPFRGICKRMGAGLTYTEMVSAKGLHYNPDSRTSRQLLTFDADEVPCAVQIFGSEPEIMATQAAGVCERYGSDVAIIDINMGCPVTKVIAKGEGSALMRTPELAAEIVRRVVDAVPVPVTVKFRSGWDSGEINAVEFGRAMQEAGASALGVHGRTRGQFYKGRADWSVIAQVKDAVDVPVIGSGDVFTADDVVCMLSETGVDGVMVARGAQGNPWIFREARALIDTGVRIDPPTPLERIDMAVDHGRALYAFAGHEAVSRMRKHVVWYFSGMPGATYARTRVNECHTYDELEALFSEYRAYVEGCLRRGPELAATN